MTALIVENVKITVQKVERTKRGLTKEWVNAIIARLSQENRPKRIEHFKKTLKKFKKVLDKVKKV